MLGESGSGAGSGLLRRSLTSRTVSRESRFFCGLELVQTERELVVLVTVGAVIVP